ncbi:hypothetical protein DJFAAGMI_01399 [Comamonas sp. PE63]|uniref:Uncharacterized protein n=1 Tax=Comamonas brasiliensis TaxID=1812482 RepID=A0ABS5LRH8_9BURK|nr:hypothetical protein [Comamonas sp. PE63]
MQQALDTATGMAIPISISLTADRITTGDLHTGLGTTIIITCTVHLPIGLTQVMADMEIIVLHMAGIGRVEAMDIAELHVLRERAKTGKLTSQQRAS